MGSPSAVRVSTQGVVQLRVSEPEPGETGTRVGGGVRPGVAYHSLSRLRASTREGDSTWSFSSGRTLRASTRRPRPSDSRVSP